MQTILGAGGVIAIEMAKHLPQFTDKIRLVSRNPKKINPTDDIMPADLTDAAQVNQAVAGSQVVYLVAGLEYKTTIWRQQWPVIMTNVINACREHGAKLVFFDNLYAYGRLHGWMTETTPYSPCSKKGEIRRHIAEQLMEAAAAGKVKALIARAADFYGPNAPKTFMQLMVFDKLQNGKTANWMVNADVKHSLTFTPDAGKATVLLGNTGSAYNQIWHLPTAKNPLTGREIVEKVAALYSAPAKLTVLSRGMLALVGLFLPVVRESLEMLYQYETDYLFDSSKFEKAFFPATPYEEGLRQTVEKSET